MKALKIIKIGGNIINDKVALNDFLKHFAQIEGYKILVHGGGTIASKIMEQMQLPVKMIDGRRVTDTHTLEVITMVYAGKINKNIVATLQSNQCNAIGFTGADGNTILAEKRAASPIDFGFVGDVTQVNTSALKLLLEHGITPVFCAITHDHEGNLLNTNADTIAAALANAFALESNTSLYYCFDKPGVLYDITNPESVIETITPNTYETLQKEGIITDGMLPKLNNCFSAIKNNVATVHLGKPELLWDSNIKHTTIKNQ